MNIIIKSFYSICNELGCGFPVSIYLNVLRVILRGYGLQLEKQKIASNYFRYCTIRDYGSDTITGQKIIVGIKAANNSIHGPEAQLLNYLKSSNTGLGLLLDFNKEPEIKNFINNPIKN